MHVFPLSFLINSFTSKRGKRISWSHQVVIFWSGLRGAIAFALAIRHSDTEADQLMLSTTLAIVLFTVLIQGGTTPAVMKLLGIK